MDRKTPRVQKHDHRTDAVQQKVIKEVVTVIIEKRLCHLVIHTAAEHHAAKRQTQKDKIKKIHKCLSPFTFFWFRKTHYPADSSYIIILAASEKSMRWQRRSVQKLSEIRSFVIKYINTNGNSNRKEKNCQRPYDRMNR